MASFLVRSTKYYLDSIYLAGYAAECSLKSLILKRTPRSKWADACKEISSGVKAHDLDYLAGILRRKNGSIPGEMIAILNAIKLEWTTNLRYVGAVVPIWDAENFLEHVQSIYGWVERS